MTLRVADRQLKVLPLHLVCALKPPLTVIEVLLGQYAEAASLPIRTGRVARDDMSTRRWKSFRLGYRIQQWKRRRQGAFPIDSKGRVQQKFDEQQVLLPKNISTPSGKTAYFSAQQGPEEINFTDNDDQSNASSSRSSLSSRMSWQQKRGVVLQLSPSGGLKPMPIVPNKTNSTEGSSEASSGLFRVKWDLKPLCEHIVNEGSLLPLHIACLYRSSDLVVSLLASSYPSATLAPIQGMLPIHWVAAGWVLPRFQPRANPTLLPSPPEVGPLPLLKALRQASPESLRVQSGNHGMTPINYIEECMEEGQYKEACTRIVSTESCDVDSIESAASIVFVDSDDIYYGNSVSRLSSSTASSKELVACITALIADRNWEQVLALIEDDPSLAGYWLYGVDDEMEAAPKNRSVKIWRRLPIHLACQQKVPVGLITVLIEAYPEGASVADPQYGLLPLHLAVSHGAGLPVVKRLLEACPEATMAVDPQGQMPLHKAVLSVASYAVVEALVEVDPYAISAVDRDGKTPIDYAKQLYGGKSLVTELLETVFLFQKSN